jgi:D-hydantoinase
MMPVDSVITNGKIVSPSGIIQAGVAIDDGKIVAIAAEGNLPEAERTIDAHGNYVLPGIIDVHTHLGNKHPLKEDVKDTIGAAFGGVTTVGNFLGLGNEPGKGSYTEGFERWKETWEEGALIDVFFHGSILSETNLNEIKLNARRYGVASCKFYMAYKGPEGEQIGAVSADDGLLWAGFKEIADIGYPFRAQVHAENIDIIYRIKPQIEATGRQDLAAWDDARPGFCETLDVQRAISIARLTGAPLYIVHVHYGASVDVIAKAISEGVDVFAETCPQYLVLDRTAPLGVLGKVNPPITDKASSERLWRGIREGTIGCIGTDHCSVTKGMKKEMWKGATPGLPGVQSLLPIMLSEGVNQGRITLEKLVEVLCYNNARTFGIFPRKGTIRAGSDADLVIVDLDKKAKMTFDPDHGCYDYTPYEGWEITGWPVLTMLRGNVLVEKGRLVAEPGTGKYVPRYVS